MPKFLVNAMFLIMPCMAIGAQQAPASGNPSRQRAADRTATIFDEHKTKPQILLLGVFHFAGEQVDANTTPVNLRVDMLSTDRQKQVVALVKRLADFKPTRIAIEESPSSQAKVDSEYRDYRAGKLLGDNRLPPGDRRLAQLADERTQLAFRLAAYLGLDHLDPVDAQPFRFALSARDSQVTFEKYKDQPIPDAAYWEGKYSDLSAYHDTLKASLSLKDYLAYLNSARAQARSVGRWLVTTKRGTGQEPIGADGFITRYFNRNVRIYSNIQRLVTRDDERILVIYGATHMYFLKQLFAASPEFSLVDVERYLR